ncbi:MAG: hypothetical protein ACTH0V_05080 [Microbacteriaceae bacterium]
MTDSSASTDSRHDESLARPEHGWLGLMCRGLGPLPAGPLPDSHDFRHARRYRVLPYVTILLPLTVIVTLVSLVPALSWSPVNAVGYAAGGESGKTTATLIVGALLVVVLLVVLFRVGPRRLYSRLFMAAVEEELWFRYGSESWTPGQRLRSCLQFGVAHFANLIVTVATLGALAIMGAVLMGVYRREARRTGSHQRALITAAYFHADYNVAACAWLALAVTALGVLLAVS